MTAYDVAILGGGVGGLSSALSLAGQGLSVTLIEAHDEVGGKMRALPVGSGHIDAGPTVFTMRWVFEELFGEAGLSFDDAVELQRADILARHAWDETGHVDLYADAEASADAIGNFCGAQEARAFRAFAQEARTMYELLEKPFLRSAKPSPLGMTASLGPKGFAVRPFSTLWRAIGGHFSDPRLVQLFGRYSTYTGASPYLAPATLMLIAHVEMDGVWLVKGGMRGLALALRKACERLGVQVRTGCPVESIAIENGRAAGLTLQTGERVTARNVVANCDASALGLGLLGGEARRAAKPVKPAERSLSAIAWTLEAPTNGFPLEHHSVFFGTDYPEEFDATFRRGQFPGDPTVYICAQDRGHGADAVADGAPERMLMVINAPPTGDMDPTLDEEMMQCTERALTRLLACGLTVKVNPEASLATGPTALNQLFPGSGGALYGRANHSPFASFKRPDNRTAIPGLYLAGGSVHPGPGVPMAALSGRLAAAQLLADRASMRPRRQTVTVGGTLTA
ncbi:MAG: phytoene desaturase [Devosiaceae bacterium]|nr:phytoene desaturase [Devosiaceae bacterium MH13]